MSPDRRQLAIRMLMDICIVPLGRGSRRTFLPDSLAHQLAPCKYLTRTGPTAGDPDCWLRRPSGR